MFLLASVVACGGGGKTGSAAKLPAAVLATIPGPGTMKAQASGTYVGQATGSDAYVAVVVQGREGVAYICDGKRLAEWFSLSHSGNDITGRGLHGSRLSAKLSNRRVTGTVHVASDGALRFQASPAVHGVSGLFHQAYASEATKYRRGWILLATGTRGADTFTGGITKTISVNQEIFVGRAGTSAFYVGLALAGDKTLAFVSDGMVAEWFRGAPSGDKLGLMSDRGARLEANVAARPVTGEFMLVDGRRFAFMASVPRTAVAGLYTFGQSLTSEKANTLLGQLSGLAGLSLVDARSRLNTSDILVTPAMYESAWVVLDDGTVNGQYRNVDTKRLLGNLVDVPTDVLVMVLARGVGPPPDATVYDANTNFVNNCKSLKAKWTKLVNSEAGLSGTALQAARDQVGQLNITTDNMECEIAQ